MTSKKWVYFRTAKNYNLGQASHSNTISNSHQERTGTLFYREERGIWEGFFEQVSWTKARIQGDDNFPLTEL